MKSIKQPALIVVTALFFAATPAKAVPKTTDGAMMTGGALLALCISKKNEDVFACQTYIAGVIDYHRLLRSLGTTPSVDYCLPDGTTMAEVKALVVQYLYSYTEHRDFIAAPAVAMSLFKQYPCKRRK